MLRDWILTLIVLSPTFLALGIVLFVLLRRVVRHEPLRSVATERLDRDPASQ